MKVDDSGNVYVAGYIGGSGSSWAVLKYNRNGDLEWLRQRPAADGWSFYLILDPAGNIYVSGGDPDYTIIKYDPQGNEIWVAKYDGPAGGRDRAHWMVIDKANNIYVTGGSADSSGERETAVIKYDPNGNQQWVARYNSPLNFQDPCGFIAVDNNKNVYVVGPCCIGGGELNTIKYDSLGQEKWVRTFKLWSNASRSLATKIRVDAFGNVIVTGGSTDSASALDFVTIKYDSLGNTLWMAQENGPTYSEDLVIVLDLDSVGNVYISGYSGNETATIKYDISGNKLWEHRYTGPTGSTMPSGIKVDKRGNVYVAGRTMGFGSRRDFMALKLDSMGNELWAAHYVGQDTSSDDLATFADFDEMGNVYITGRSDRNGQSDILTLKYATLPALKGDLNLDGVLTMADVVLMLNFAFLGDPFAAAPSAGDLNCDGKISPADAVIMLQIFFLSVSPPC
ncbi:MAG TPA: SBBP repeat-containing protein [Verrucomicrobiae bacterium]|nr:SBBP repeat-containing protein [Verrucomicrobiae bacterium]